ncbi:MAG: hypothetical protein M0Z46_04835 [Actinomycetota bacterium]|nr:hypothetical protein [Actinomycetota bacterium]
MADPELGAELEATLAARRELGEDYDAVLVGSFLEKLEREVDAKVKAALAARDAGKDKHASRSRRRGGAGLAIPSIALGIPVSAVVASNLHGTDSLIGVIVAWAAIAVINVANTFERRAR